MFSLCGLCTQTPVQEEMGVSPLPSPQGSATGTAGCGLQRCLAVFSHPLIIRGWMNIVPGRSTTDGVIPTWSPCPSAVITTPPTERSLLDCCDAVYTWRGQWVDDSALNCDWLRNIANNALQKQWLSLCVRGVTIVNTVICKSSTNILMCMILSVL